MDIFADPIKPEWRNGRRDGLKIHCPLKMCGFESRLGHETGWHSPACLRLPEEGHFQPTIPLISVHFCSRRLRDGRIVVLANTFSFTSRLFLPRRQRNGAGVVLANSANPDSPCRSAAAPIAVCPRQCWSRSDNDAVTGAANRPSTAFQWRESCHYFRTCAKTDSFVRMNDEKIKKDLDTY